MTARLALPQRPCLMLVTDRRRTQLPLIEVITQAVAGGVDIVQIREKDLAHADLLALVGEIKKVVAGRAAIVVNGDLDVAQQTGIGIHLPEEGYDLQQARELLGGEVFIGRSVHSPSVAAESTEADYLVAGHVFPTASHPDRAPLGLDGLAAITSVSPSPVIAIGGIVAANVQSVLTQGAQGIAVISAINNACDPQLAAQRLRKKLATYTRGEIMPTTEKTNNETITLQINGKPEEIAAGLTVSEFLSTRKLQAKLVAVEVNGSILSRSNFDSTMLRDGDEIEIVHFVGGGQIDTLIVPRLPEA